MFDSHIHFPINSINPYEELVGELKKNSISDFLLILNSKKEVNLFLEHYSHFKEDNLNPRVAIILDIHNPQFQDLFNPFITNSIPYSVKIHPRISNITIEDFETVLRCMENLTYNTIIVDSWFFGPNLRNHVGVELAIFLAEKLPHKNIVIAHSGGVKVLETMLSTRPLKNIFYDLALTCIYFDSTSVSLDVDHFIRYTKERIMFGSDFPDFNIDDCVCALMSHCLKVASLTEDDINKIFDGTARLLFG